MLQKTRESNEETAYQMTPPVKFDRARATAADQRLSHQRGEDEEDRKEDVE